MAKHLLKDYPGVSLKQENLRGRLDFEDIFGRSSPIHIEIGSGKGAFLVSQGRAEPQVNFIGIEWANKYYRSSVDRIGRWGFENIRIIRADAAVLLAEHTADECVDRFDIYFPDPWPKKRHHKRRFVCKQNVREMLRCLKSGGVINIATDHTDYFEQIEEAVNAENEHLERIEFIRAAGAQDGETVGTNYERKYIKDGRKIYTIAVRKTGI